MHPDAWANVWNCALNTTFRYMWCGDELKTRPCQNNSHVHVIDEIVQGDLETLLGSPQLTTSSNNIPSTIFSLNSVSGSTAWVAIGTITITPQPSKIHQGNSQNNSTKSFRASSSNHSVAIGAGVAVPLGLIAITVLGFFLWRRGRKNQAHINSQSSIERNSSLQATSFNIPPTELIGDVGESELESKPPIYEI